MPPAVSAIQEYRKRVKTSNCRGLGTRRCSQKTVCKYASGTMRRFCRKAKNTRRGYSSRRNSSRRSKSISYASAKSKSRSKSMSFASAKSQ